MFPISFLVQGVREEVGRCAPPAILLPEANTSVRFKDELGLFGSVEKTGILLCFPGAKWMET